MFQRFPWETLDPWNSLAPDSPIWHNASMQKRSSMPGVSAINAEDIRTGDWYMLATPNGTKLRVRADRPGPRGSKGVTSWNVVDQLGCPYRGLIAKLSPIEE